MVIIFCLKIFCILLDEKLNKWVPILYWFMTYGLVKMYFIILFVLLSTHLNHNITYKCMYCVVRTPYTVHT